MKYYLDRNWFVIFIVYFGFVDWIDSFRYYCVMKFVNVWFFFDFLIKNKVELLNLFFIL